MNLYFKFIVLLFKRISWNKKQKITDACYTKFRVGLLDLDLNFHMNNGRYFSVMDLGRFDLILKNGNLLKLFRNGYYPLILSESMVFKRSLNYFNSYQLETQVVSWDEKFFYITQKFLKDGELVSSGHVRACFKKRGRKGIVPIKEIFDFVGEEYSSQDLNSLAAKQIEIDSILFPRG